MNSDDSVTIVIDIRKKPEFQNDKLVTHEQPPPLPPRNKPLEERLSIPQQLAKIAPKQALKANKAVKPIAKDSGLDAVAENCFQTAGNLFPCPEAECSKTYSYKSALQRHQKIFHMKEKPFICKEDKCSKEFALQHHLKRHIKQVHSDEKPYQCHYCDKFFKDPYNLKVHERIHTGEKPFTCNFQSCGKSFNQKGALNMHMRIHERNKKPKLDTKLYACEEDNCTYETDEKQKIKSHKSSCDYKLNFSSSNPYLLEFFYIVKYQPKK